MLSLSPSYLPDHQVHRHYHYHQQLELQNSIFLTKLSTYTLFSFLKKKKFSCSYEYFTLNLEYLNSMIIVILIVGTQEQKRTST